MTSRPTFTSQISLGNWLTIVALVVSMVVGYTYTRASVDQNAGAIVAIGRSLDEIEIRVRATEVRAERQSGEFNALSSALADIKQQQRENNQLLRELLQRSSQ